MWTTAHVILEYLCGELCLVNRTSAVKMERWIICINKDDYKQYYAAKIFHKISNQKLISNILLLGKIYFQFKLQNISITMERKLNLDAISAQGSAFLFYCFTCALGRYQTPGIVIIYNYTELYSAKTAIITLHMTNLWTYMCIFLHIFVIFSLNILTNCLLLPVILAF